MYKPGDGGGYYFVNNTWMLAQNSWDNYSTSSIDSMGDWYGSPAPYGMQDYNAYYNNNTNKGYWGGQSLLNMRANYGTELNSHDYKDLRFDDNVLDVSYRNMWDEPARANRNTAHR